MELSIALQIIKEQSEYLKVLDWYTSGENLDKDGDVVSEIILSEFQIKKYNLDPTKLYLTEVEQFGGEGQGDTCYYVFKIEHPEHGIGYIKYFGNYDSWSGSEWDNDAIMVEPIEKTIVVYEEVG